MADARDPWIKICGLRDSHTAKAAVASGASALGFMLAESRRRIEPASIAAILSELSADRPPAVGVVVNESAEFIDRMVRETGIDIVQLAGDESPEMLAEIEHTVWKALYFPAGTTLQEASRIIESWLDSTRPPAAMLIDAAVPGSYGGTGHKADWNLASRLAEKYPVVLAGGLTPLNVAEAIGSVRPVGVDVSSGVEVDGSKDPRLIQEFIAASLRAYALIG
ncbi:MAG: phosphoribosylanthranilate isomerase [Chloroflexota bacterium]|nr:phosphoribosylanthranilate isomerase [Chloroflexota bacterium]